LWVQLLQTFDDELLSSYTSYVDVISFSVDYFF